MIFLELTLVALFLAVARYLDVENKRIAAERDDIRESYDALMVNYRCVCVERDEALQREDDVNEANIGLTEELDAYHDADMQRAAVVMTGKAWAN